MRAYQPAGQDQDRPARVQLWPGDRRPITSTIRGLSTEVAIGPGNGLDHAAVVSCDNIVTVPTSTLGRHIGYLLPAQEAELVGAIHAAFDLAEARRRADWRIASIEQLPFN